jgi:hypothetical protein
MMDWVADKFSAFNRITTDANGCRLTETGVGGLENGFIREGAGARYNADIAFGKDVAGHNSDFAFIGRHHPWAVRANQPAGRIGKVCLDLDHIKNRNSFRDTDNQRNFRVDGFNDGSACTRGRHIDD